MTKGRGLAGGDEGAGTRGRGPGGGGGGGGRREGAGGGSRWGIGVHKLHDYISGTEISQLSLHGFKT